MIRCPNCGSTAQVKVVDNTTFVWKDIVSVYLEYKCGCGCNFYTRIEADRKDEKFYGIAEKPIDK